MSETRTMDRTNVDIKDKSISSSVSSLGNHQDILGSSPVLSLKSRYTDSPDTHSTTQADSADMDNDDRVAMMMAKMLASQTEKDSVPVGPDGERQRSSRIAKRAAIIESIKWSSRHVPLCALDQMITHVVSLTDKKENQERLETPHATEYQAALLFVDMSGFTQLSQHLDVESLSKVSHQKKFGNRRNIKKRIRQSWSYSKTRIT